VLGQIAWEVGSTEDIAAYAEFRAAAQAASPDDFPVARPLSDGGLFALRLDSVTPPTPRPLDDVRAAVEAGARAEALRAALTAQAEALAPTLAAQGPEDFSETTGLVPDTYAALTRLDRMPNLPPALLEGVHAAAVGTTIIAGAGDQVFLALVTDLSEPDTLDAQTARLVEAVDAEIGSALAQDVFGYFARALEREAGIRFNQPAIDAAHAAFP
jgi:peptidyl-prolyl cis-trans isomerase D